MWESVCNWFLHCLGILALKLHGRGCKPRPAQEVKRRKGVRLEFLCEFLVNEVNCSVYKIIRTWPLFLACFTEELSLILFKYGFDIHSTPFVGFLTTKLSRTVFYATASALRKGYLLYLDWAKVMIKPIKIKYSDPLIFPLGSGWH